MYFVYIFVVIFILGDIFPLRTTTTADEIQHRRVRRNGNSYKDSISKQGGGMDTGRGMAEIMDKIDRMDAKLDKLEKHMVKNSDVLRYWTEPAGVEDSIYWKEMGGCGGVIEAQSGRIIGSSSSTVSQSECMWTIVASHRYKIKLTLHSQKIPSTLYSPNGQMSKCKVHELKVNYDKSSDASALSMTSITEDKTYLFKGPVLFLTCQCNINHRNQIFEFEGLGPRVFSRVNFQHINTDNMTGSYDLGTELNTIGRELSDKDATFITIVIPGLDHNKLSPMRNVILQNLGSNFCKHSSLSMHFDLGDPDTMMTLDCCQVDCLKHKFLVRDDYCLITIGVNMSTVFDGTSSPVGYTTLNWDIQEHTQLKTSTELACGGIISGKSSGTISETYSGYKANSRCIWVIHPFPKTEINVTIHQLQIEEGHDYLFAVGIDDAGELVTTPLIEDDKTYELSGRVILIVFYSDTSLQQYGFALSWIAKAGPANMHMFTNDDKIKRYTELNGTANWNIAMPPSWPGLHFGVINHFNAYQPYSYDLRLDYGLVGSGMVVLYGSTNGTFNLLVNATTKDISTDVFDSKNFTSSDGVFLILASVHDHKPNSSIVLDFDWKRGKAEIPTSYSACGGRIEPARQARINFKTGQSIGTNIRCVWLIECRYQNVSFNLLKNGVKRIGVISIDTIDPQTGKIALNSTKTISSTTNNIVVSGPLILLTFTSSSVLISSDTGFELEYTGTGENIQDGKKYEMRHWNSALSNVEYPTGEEVPSSNDLLVLGQNPDATTTSISQKLTLQFMSHQMTNNSIGHGYNFSLYSFKPWNSNNTFQPAVDCTIVTGVLEEECNFYQNYVSSDFHSKSETFDMKFDQSGFLAIVKPLEEIQASASREFQLSWNTGGCGGLISLPNGKVEYKLYQNYASNENCIWIVDGTKFGASSIAFNLDVSGLLERDAIYVYPVSSGSIGTPVRLRYETSSYYLPAQRNVTVSSGVALVTFRSSVTSLYSSAIGKGFSISYTLRRVRTKATTVPGKTLVIYPNLASAEMELPMKKRLTSLNQNDTVIMFFNSPPSSSSSSSTATVLNFTIEELNLFINSKTCLTDSLYFYYYSYSSFYLKDAFRSYKDPEATCNETITTALDTDVEEADHDGYEESIYEEITAAPRKVIKNTCNPQCYETNVSSTLTPSRRHLAMTTPMIIIYKSNTNHTDGKKVRFTWNFNATDTTDVDW